MADSHTFVSPFDDAERDKRVAEAAYYRAEKRGFAYGFALEDWLAAENLIDHEMKNGILSEPADKSRRE